MRAALVPITSHNPDVQHERLGWCVMWEHYERDQEGNVVRYTYRFLDRLTEGDPLLWSKSAGAAIVFGFASDARSRSDHIKGCVLTSVPRFNGSTYEWLEHRPVKP